MVVCHTRPTATAVCCLQREVNKPQPTTQSVSRSQQPRCSCASCVVVCRCRWRCCTCRCRCRVSSWLLAVVNVLHFFERWISIAQLVDSMLRANILSRRRSAPVVDSGQSLAEPPSKGDLPPAVTDSIVVGPSTFLHNASVSLTIIPCLVVMLIFGGERSLVLFTCGSLISYALDFNGFQDVTLVSIWSTAALVAVSLIASSMHMFRISMYNVAFVYILLLVLTCTACWASLQFRYLQEVSPRIVLMMERSIFAILPCAVPPLLSWAIIAYSTASTAMPYYYLMFTAVCYVLYSVPTVSSYRKGRRGSLLNETLVLSRFESFVHLLHLIFAPTVVNVALNHHHLWTTWDDLAQSLFLAVAPIILFAAMSPLDSWHCLGVSESVAKKASKIIALAGVVVVTWCAEVRFIRHAIHDIISVPQPFGDFLVGIPIYMLVFLVYTHVTSNASSGSVLFQVIAVTSGLLLSFAIGMPLVVKPFLVAALFFLVRFIGTKSMKDYLLFVLCGMICTLWFVRKTFWWIDFEFDSLPMSLFHISLCVLLLTLATLIVPGYMGIRKPRDRNDILSFELVDALFIFQAFGLLFCEGILYQQGIGMYPPMCVITTSAAGLLICGHLLNMSKISVTVATIAGNLYIAKLGVLFWPVPLALLTSFLLCVIISPMTLALPLLVGKLSDSHQDLDLFVQTTTTSRSPVLVPRFIALIVVSLLTRHSLLTSVITSILAHSPNEALVLGTTSIFIGLCGFSITSVVEVSIRKTAGSFLLFGASIALLQPNLSIISSFFTLKGLDTVDDPSDGAAWLVIIGCLVVAAAGVLIPTEVVIPRLCAALVGGSFIGLHVYYSYLPSSMLSATFVVAEAALFVSWLVLFVRPASSGSSILNIVTSLLQCFCLFSVLLTPIMIGTVTLPGAAENLSLLRSSFVAIWAVANLIIALLVKIQLSGEKSSKKFSRADWSWLPTQVLPFTLLF
jgi:hypothetical protein